MHLLGLRRLGLRLAVLWLAGLAGQAAAEPVGPPPQVLQLSLDGRRVPADVHAPPAGVAWRGAAVLSHGFTRSRATMAGHARALAAHGVLSVALELPYTFDFDGNARALRALVAQLRAGRLSVAGEPAAEGVWPLGMQDLPVVLLGFSAGGLSSLLAADAPGVAGYVGLDPFDRVPPGEPGLGARAAAARGVPAVLLRAGPSRCNAQSAALPWVALLPRLQADTVIDGASHCDFESPSDGLCRWACGATDLVRQQRIQAALVAAVTGWLPAR